MKEDANKVMVDKQVDLGDTPLVLPADKNEDQSSQKHEEPVAISLAGDAASETRADAFKAVLDKNMVADLEPFANITKEAIFTEKGKLKDLDNQKDALALEERFDALFKGLDVSMKIGTSVSGTCQG
jgi:hypothetical protein